jgi:hypothetical protein
MRGRAVLSLGLVALFLLSGALTGPSSGGSRASPPNSVSPLGTNMSPMPAIASLRMALDSVVDVRLPAATEAGDAAVHVGNLSRAKNISSSFWGVNVAAQQSFRSPDAANIAASPASYIRFPGGDLGEELNYTSGVFTGPYGATSNASTTPKEFVTACEAIDCHAILQLPAEIDQPQTAADYASYVVHTLHYQPAFWEIGNSVPSWTHFDRPWSQWGTKGGSTITPTLFAELVANYTTAVAAVDPEGQFIALGSGMGTAHYAESWITALAQADGHQLVGISVHSYVIGAGPTKPTWSDLLANLNGQYSLPEQVTADEGYLSSACPTCHLQLFVTEVNAAEDNSYVPLIRTFAGVLYAAAETAQALNLGVTNLDWFCYNGHYGGAWMNAGGRWQLQYTLFTQVLTQLGDQTLPVRLTGPATLYAVATLGPSGRALLLVNVNATHAVTVSLDNSGFGQGTVAHLSTWLNGTKGPSNSTVTLGSTLTVPALSILVIT